jgi:hypothetical protein
MRKNQLVLQVKTSIGWQYVFCYNRQMHTVCTTKDYRKALPASAITYFQNKFAVEFRGIKPAECETK